MLGVPTERVWELLARGVLSGVPDGETGMRVFLQPRPVPPAVDEPRRSNGGSSGREPEAEASPFRELLSEFRNLTERYGQALLALGESRGEVASLRSRVDLLEARFDLRLPMSGARRRNRIGRRRLDRPPARARADGRADPSRGCCRGTRGLSPPRHAGGDAASIAPRTTSPRPWPARRTRARPSCPAAKRPRPPSRRCATRRPTGRPTMPTPRCHASFRQQSRSRSSSPTRSPRSCRSPSQRPRRPPRKLPSPSATSLSRRSRFRLRPSPKRQPSSRRRSMRKRSRSSRTRGRGSRGRSDRRFGSGSDRGANRTADARAGARRRGARGRGRGRRCDVAADRRRARGSGDRGSLGARRRCPHPRG